jgi:hypothetical protein
MQVRSTPLTTAGVSSCMNFRSSTGRQKPSPSEPATPSSGFFVLLPSARPIDHSWELLSASMKTVLVSPVDWV